MKGIFCFLFHIPHFLFLSFSRILFPSSTLMPVPIFHIDLIVDDILQYLDEADIHNCRRINKSLSSMVNQLFWKHLKLPTGKLTQADIRSICDNSSSARSLIIRGRNEKLASTADFNRLEHLALLGHVHYVPSLLEIIGT
ncbi:MAG: hypothetical protein BYD32DRAFT_407244 [Podila humilis]|nr:MAG: hypothetical protein BYD32DRAFT_407244 [Podila humilis]